MANLLPTWKGGVELGYLSPPQCSDDESSDGDTPSSSPSSPASPSPTSASAPPIPGMHADVDHRGWDGGVAGGRPSWLIPTGLPSPAAMACRRCGEPLAFLLQIYAPLDDAEDAFHRTLYLFCCRDGRCVERNSLLALRGQLPRVNGVYPADPAAASDAVLAAGPQGDAQQLCGVCGCAGRSACGKCKQRWYCGRAHQVADWRGGHKAECPGLRAGGEGLEGAGVAGFAAAAAVAEGAEKATGAAEGAATRAGVATGSSCAVGVVLPENWIVIETEPEEALDKKDKKKKQKKKKKKKGQQQGCGGEGEGEGEGKSEGGDGDAAAVSDGDGDSEGGGEGGSDTDNDDGEEGDTKAQADAAAAAAGGTIADADDEDDITEKDLEEAMEALRGRAVENDKQFIRFQRRTAAAADQCLRYARWPAADDKVSGPLWAATAGQATAADVPCCESCGGPRGFEFQVTPQMLHYLGMLGQVLDTGGDTASAAGGGGSASSSKTDLTWGTLAVYTCRQSCSASQRTAAATVPKAEGEASAAAAATGDQSGDGKEKVVVSPPSSASFGSYHQEFVWRQPGAGES